MNRKFETFDVARALIVALRPAIEQIAQRNRDLADQVRRAAASVLLNIAEGARRQGRDRTQFYRIAAGSTAEVRAALEVAQAWDVVERFPEVEALLDRVLAMLWRLTHPRPGP